MSWIEKLLLITILIYFFILIMEPFKRKTVRLYLPVVAFAWMISNMLYDTITWQLLPVYFLTATLCMASLIDIGLSKSAKKRPAYEAYDNRKKIIGLSSIALILTGLMFLAFPL